jgi:hypothetical protein
VIRAAVLPLLSPLFRGAAAARRSCRASVRGCFCAGRHRRTHVNALYIAASPSRQVLQGSVWTLEEAREREQSRFDVGELKHS